MTYSVVARDPITGELGVAVQSHWFAVGPIVPWARPGVGAVATQANAEVSYGPRGLELLGAGAAAPDALRPGTPPGMVSRVMWPTMLDTFGATEGPLTLRLMAVLDAAEEAGGDIRGRQSAAIVVVPTAGNWWERVVSLHVEDHPEPLVELRRLVELHGAYELAGQADESVNEGRHDEAARLYGMAGALAPDSHELRFWAGLGAAQAGEIDRGLDDVRAAIAMQPGWRPLLERLPADVAPSAAAVLERLRSEDH